MLEFGGENEEIREKAPTVPWLVSLTDTEDNRLRIVIALAMEGEEGEGLEEIPETQRTKADEMLARSRPVYMDTTRAYEIVFDRYVMYQTRNESYTVWDKYEIRRGNYLILFERSRLLDYAESVLFDFDDEETKRGRRHYGVYTEDHIIDIIANHPPTIRKIDLPRKPD